MRAIVLVSLLLGLALPAHAGDGLLEISQTCAVSTGCFPGDAAGFPVTIVGGVGSSYILTSDLQVPNENTRAIQISAAGTSLDLGGFAIRGVTSCSGSPVTCSPAGSGNGVAVVPFTLSGVRVANGSIIGMGSHGISLGASAVVEGVRALSNGGTGIGGGDSMIARGNVSQLNGLSGVFGSRGSVLTENTVNDNGGPGLACGNGCVIASNTIGQNGSNGVICGDACNVAGNTASENGSTGIQAAADANIRKNTVKGNIGTGIVCTFGCSVSGNTLEGNGSGVAPFGFGIQIDSGSHVFGNTIRNHPQLGVSGLNPEFGYRGNVLTGNNGGNANQQVGSFGTDLGGNLCGSPVACP